MAWPLQIVPYPLHRTGLQGPTTTHLLDHADELREGPVELVEDAVEEAGRHVRILAQQVCHVLLQQGGGAGLCRGMGRRQRRGLRSAALPGCLCPHSVGRWHRTEMALEVLRPHRQENGVHYCLGLRAKSVPALC